MWRSDPINRIQKVRPSTFVRHRQSAQGTVARGPFGGWARVADLRCFLLVFVLAQLSMQAVVGLLIEIQLTQVGWRSQS